MKKIFRLIWVLVALLLVFYATNYVNECQQMRHVFDSWVVVENLPSSKRCSIVNDTLSRSYELLHFMDNPRPLWNDVGGIYAYSAFWKKETDGGYALAVGVGLRTDLTLECHLWFDYRNIVTSVPGEFSYVSKEWNSTVSVYELFCAVEEKFVKGEPTVLIINSKVSGRAQTRIPIFHKAVDGSDNHTAVCVKPDPAGTGKSDIVEFISFHLLVGVTDMVLYGNDIHFNIIHKVRQLVGASSFLRSLSLLPWNFPYSDPSLELRMIRIDCEYRTFGLTKAFAVLDWDQYIVPLTPKPILDLLDPQDRSVVVRARSQICCLENHNDKLSESSWPVILKKTYCMDYPIDSFLKVHSRELGTREDAVIKNYSSAISIKTYRGCIGLKNVRTKYDHSPLKYVSGLLSSELLRLWRTGNLF